MLLKLYIDYTIGIWKYQYVPMVYIKEFLKVKSNNMSAFNKAAYEMVARSGRLGAGGGIA